MKRALPMALTLLLSACPDDPAMTFGLQLRAVERAAPGELVSDSCLPPGRAHGNFTASSIDIAIGDAPPHLFIEADPDGHEDVYRVQVYTASERDADGFWWEPSEVLAERRYDTEFGRSGARDSFVVDFEGRQYTFEIVGLPATATCLME